MSGPKFKEPKADEFLHRDTFELTFVSENRNLDIKSLMFQ